MLIIPSAPPAGRSKALAFPGIQLTTAYALHVVHNPRGALKPDTERGGYLNEKPSPPLKRFSLALRAYPAKPRALSPNRTEAFTAAAARPS
jgi:hypothetical protein